MDAVAQRRARLAQLRDAHAAELAGLPAAPPSPSVSATPGALFDLILASQHVRELCRQKDGAQGSAERCADALALAAQLKHAARHFAQVYLAVAHDASVPDDSKREYTTSIAAMNAHHWPAVAADMTAVLLELRAQLTRQLRACRRELRACEAAAASLASAPETDAGQRHELEELLAQEAAVRADAQREVAGIASNANRYNVELQGYVAGELAPLEEVLAQLMSRERELEAASSAQGRGVEGSDGAAAGARAACALREQQLVAVLAARRARLAALVGGRGAR